MFETSGFDHQFGIRRVNQQGNFNLKFVGTWYQVFRTEGNTTTSGAMVVAAERQPRDPAEGQPTPEVDGSYLGWRQGPVAQDRRRIVEQRLELTVRLKV